jgi:hypothetical protein
MKNIVAILFLTMGYCCGVQAEEQTEQEKEFCPSSYMASMEQVDDESGCEAEDEESAHSVA